MKKSWLLSLTLFLMLPLAACDTGENEAEEANDSQEEVEEDLVEDKEEDIEDTQKDKERETLLEGVNYDDAKLSPEAAFNKFMESHTDAEITEVKFDTKSDELEYKVEGHDTSNEFQMRIDAVSEDINKDERKELDEDDKDEGVITNDDISKVDGLIDKAMNEAAEDLKFKKWSLEEDDGRLEFEIEFKNSEGEDLEYTYDLNSGELLEKDD